MFRPCLIPTVSFSCYVQVLAAAQAGKHNEKRESYGDAIIVDPWGKVIARLPGT